MRRMMRTVAVAVTAVAVVWLGQAPASAGGVRHNRQTEARLEPISVGGSYTVHFSIREYESTGSRYSVPPSTYSSRSRYACASFSGWTEERNGAIRRYRGQGGCGPLQTFSFDAAQWTARASGTLTSRWTEYVYKRVDGRYVQSSRIDRTGTTKISLRWAAPETPQFANNPYTSPTYVGAGSHGYVTRKTITSGSIKFNGLKRTVKVPTNHVGHLTVHHDTDSSVL